MADHYLSTLVRSASLEAQTKYYGKARPEDPTSEHTPLGPSEKTFIASRDSFYLGTVHQDGWPYVQHRGGPAGFIRALDEHTLAFADYRGNRQLISTGNVSGNSRVSLFFMDYPQRARLKLIGYSKVQAAQDAPELAEALAQGIPEKRIERIFTIDVVSFDWNCPQFITPRYTEAEIEPLKQEIAELHRQLSRLRKEASE